MNRRWCWRSPYCVVIQAEGRATHCEHFSSSHPHAQSGLLKASGEMEGFVMGAELLPLR